MAEANELPPGKRTLGWPEASREPAIAQAAADHGQATVAALKAKFGDAISEENLFRGDWCVTVSKEKLHDAAVFLKMEMGYKQFSSVSGVDHYPDEPRFRVVYMRTHMQKKNQFRFQVRLDPAQPRAVEHRVEQPALRPGLGGQA